MSNVIHDPPTDFGPNAAAGSEQLARQQAIKQIERRRRFRVSAAASGIGMIVRSS
jgi:hypothetical protein